MKTLTTKALRHKFCLVCVLVTLWPKNREILIARTKPEQHVTGYVEHLVLLIFR